MYLLPPPECVICDFGHCSCATCGTAVNLHNVVSKRGNGEMVVFMQDYTTAMGKQCSAFCPHCKVTYYHTHTDIHQQLAYGKVANGLHRSEITLAGFEVSSGRIRKDPAYIGEGDCVVSSRERGKGEDEERGKGLFGDVLGRVNAVSEDGLYDITILPIVKVFNKSSTACEFIVCTECTAFEVHKLRVLDAQLLHVTFFRSEKSVSSDVME